MNKPSIQQADRPAEQDVQAPVPLAQALLGTLDAEHEALVRLCAGFEQQLDALRARHPDALEQAAQQTNELLNRLAHLRQTRERQMHLLGLALQAAPETASLPRLADALRPHRGGDAPAQRLLEARTRIHQQAAAAQQRCRELEAALQYAVDLGRTLMQALQGLDEPALGRVYTAHGGTAQAAAPPSLLNKLG